MARKKSPVDPVLMKSQRIDRANIQRGDFETQEFLLKTIEPLDGSEAAWAAVGYFSHTLMQWLLNGLPEEPITYQEVQSELACSPLAAMAISSSLVSTRTAIFCTRSGSLYGETGGRPRNPVVKDDKLASVVRELSMGGDDI